MIVAITGTPGTGKTTLIKNLDSIGHRTLELNKVIEENNFITGYDDERDTQEVDLEKVDKYLKEHIGKDYESTILFIDSHLSHNLTTIDLVIVLRCHPTTLEARLQQAGYAEPKIRENLEAEAVDVITIESVEMHGHDKVYEIDVTAAEPNDVPIAVLEIAKGKNRDKYKVGNIDWSEEILKWY